MMEKIVIAVAFLAVGSVLLYVSLKSDWRNSEHPAVRGNAQIAIYTGIALVIGGVILLLKQC